MKTHINLNYVFLTALATCTLVFLALTYSPVARAVPAESTKVADSKAITVAYYYRRGYGYGYRGYGFRGPYRGYYNRGYAPVYRGYPLSNYRCVNRCSYNRWGNPVRCVRVCN